MPSVAQLDDDFILPARPWHESGDHPGLAVDLEVGELATADHGDRLVDATGLPLDPGRQAERFGSIARLPSLDDRAGRICRERIQPREGRMTLEDQPLDRRCLLGFFVDGLGAEVDDLPVGGQLEILVDFKGLA